MRICLNNSMCGVTCKLMFCSYFIYYKKQDIFIKKHLLSNIVKTYKFKNIKRIDYLNKYLNVVVFYLKDKKKKKKGINIIVKY